MTRIVSKWRRLSLPQSISSMMKAVAIKNMIFIFKPHTTPIYFGSSIVKKNLSAFVLPIKVASSTSYAICRSIKIGFLPRFKPSFTSSNPTAFPSSPIPKRLSPLPYHLKRKNHKEVFTCPSKSIGVTILAGQMIV